MVFRLIKATLVFACLFTLGACTQNKSKELKEPVSDLIKSLDKDKPHKFVTFSFDDGTIQDKRLAELFNKYGIKCTFNVNTGSLGNDGTLTVSEGTVDFTKLTAEEMKKVYSGHEVAVHTVNHPDLRTCDDERIIKEVNDDFNAIQDIMGQRVVGMAYPGGPFFDDRVIDVIVNNTEIKYAREVTGTNSFEMPDNFMIWKPTCHWTGSSKLVDKFISTEAQEDMLLYIWGHSWEFDLNDRWDEFERILEKLSKEEDLIFVTNSEIYYYMTKD